MCLLFQYKIQIQISIKCEIRLILVDTCLTIVIQSNSLKTETDRKIKFISFSNSVSLVTASSFIRNHLPICGTLFNSKDKIIQSWKLQKKTFSFCTLCSYNWCVICLSLPKTIYLEMQSLNKMKQCPLDRKSKINCIIYLINTILYLKKFLYVFPFTITCIHYSFQMHCTNTFLQIFSISCHEEMLSVRLTEQYRCIVHTFGQYPWHIQGVHQRVKSVS